MVLDPYAALGLTAATIAILMLGTTDLRLNLSFFALHTILIAVEAVLLESLVGREHSYIEPICFGLFKGIGAPLFLNWIIQKVNVQRDTGYLSAALSMHLGILLLGVSYLLSVHLPRMVPDVNSTMASMAALSLLFTGVLIMTTRKLAISQIIGFLVLENGIYVFTLTQTHGMPMMVGMGVLLDVLVGVMIGGMLLFNIKKSFEHIDVTQLTDLRD